MDIEFHYADSAFNECDLMKSNGDPALYISMDESLHVVAEDLDFEKSTTEELLKGLRAWKA